MSLLIEEMKIAEMPMATLAASFREFYHRDPWLEVKRCPACNPPDDFGPTGRYGDDKLERCPVCQTPLEEYWSDDRVASYFCAATERKNFIGVVGRNHDGEIVAWTWGYAVEEIPELEFLPTNGCYVDVVGVQPDYRDNSMQIFFEGHALGYDRGFRYFVTRTHVRADYVKRAMSLAGYKYLSRSIQNPDREYWMLGNGGV